MGAVKAVATFRGWLYPGPLTRIISGDTPPGRGTLNTTIAVIGIIIAAGLIIATFIIQTVRTGRAPIGKALSLYREVKHNEGLARKFGYQGRVKPFRNEVWLRLKQDIEFLPQDLRTLMGTAYEEVARLNETIEGSIEHLQESHLSTVNTAPVQEKFQRIRRDLDGWIKMNLTNPNYAPKRPKFLWW